MSKKNTSTIDDKMQIGQHVWAIFEDKLEFWHVYPVRLEIEKITTVESVAFSNKVEYYLDGLGDPVERNLLFLSRADARKTCNKWDREDIKWARIGETQQ